MDFIRHESIIILCIHIFPDFDIHIILKVYVCVGNLKINQMSKILM